MISIKDSFADCSTCQLLDAPSCILETNSKVDLTQVEIVFVAENPGKNEVAKKPEPAPLVGKSGRMFRKYFAKYELNKVKYLLTNTVLCQTINPDKTTGNPEPDVIERCKMNCMEIIRQCKPKLIVLMGATPMSAFGIAKSGITNLHGKTFEWEGFKVFLTIHPSFANRNLKVWEPKFEEDMLKISDLLNGVVSDVSFKVNEKKIGEGIYRYKIPEKFYTDDYRLIDVQFISKKQEVLYIFRDRNNKKIYHTESDEYICYQIKDGVEARKIIPYEDLKQISLSYRDRNQLDPDITYEGDIRITTKHAMDYYHFNKGDAPKVESNVMFFDIEIDTGKEKIFPSPIEAEFSINMFTSIYNGVTTTYVLDNKTEPIEKVDGVVYKIFDIKDENKMLRTFMKDFRDTDPDFISGWNLISFDMQYIFNRIRNLKIPDTLMTKFGEFFVDGARWICLIPGCVAIDQDFLYRTFTFTKMENYKLGFIAESELGRTKIQLPLSFNEMYWQKLNMTIKYNIRDTELLKELDDKLGHINLLNELRIICNTSFDSVTSMGQIDSLMVSYLRSKGIASKNSDPHISKESYPGAYVYEPIPGLYSWITDFDFKSLYPSLMITYNIGINSFVMKTTNPHLGYDIAYNPEKLPDKISVVVDPLYKKELVEIDKNGLLKLIKEKELVYTVNGCFFNSHKKKFSVFGEVVEMLMSSRDTYKSQMFDAIEKKDKNAEKFFYTRQLVYKVLANTLYGVVANKSFRFYDLSLASAITLTGQEALKTSIIEGDALMRSMATGIEYIKPKTLTKEEMFADPKAEPELYTLPDRSNDFIITGDTDSIFCKFENFVEEKTIDNIRKWCDKIEDFLNNDKIAEVVKRYNVNLEYNRLKLKNELIISRGLFLAKKRYAIHVVNNEGKEVDKTNFMGVEIKRSDYPSKSKEFLIELSELLLKSKSEKMSPPKIMDFINRSKRDFVEMIRNGDKKIGRPVSWGKKLEDYKMVPQGVRSMQAWNSIMYDIHRTGAKGYLYWVKGIDIDKAPKDVLEKYHKFISGGKKLEVIAIPDEEEKLPHYFIPDVQSTLKFTFEDRHALFLKPLFKAIEEKKNEVILF